TTTSSSASAASRTAMRCWGGPPRPWSRRGWRRAGLPAEAAHSRPGATSVARDRGVHVLRPGIDATGDVVDPGETKAAEMLGRGAAALAAVAQERDRGVLGQLLQLGGTTGLAVEGAERHVHGRLLALRGGAHVDQHQLAGLRHLRGFGG